MSAEVDALTVVNQLRDLAADPLNRRAIVEDQGCLPGLILFLDHPNPQVVYSALLVGTPCFAHCSFFQFLIQLIFIQPWLINAGTHKFWLQNKVKPDLNRGNTIHLLKADMTKCS